MGIEYQILHFGFEDKIILNNSKTSACKNMEHESEQLWSRTLNRFENITFRSVDMLPQTIKNKGFLI